MYYIAGFNARERGLSWHSIDRQDLTSFQKRELARGYHAAIMAEKIS